MGVKVTKTIDLHLHLDGAISLKSARELAQLQCIPIPDSDDELMKLMRVSPECRNLREFLEKFDFPCRLLQTEIGIETAMFNLCEELRADGVIYAEIRFAPSKCKNKGLSQEQAVRAALKGMKRSSLNSMLILCCMRGNRLNTNEETIRIAKHLITRGIGGVDLAGDEGRYATAKYDKLFELAQELEVPFTIHAGEAAGADSVMAALRLGAHRIGHATHAPEDPQVMKFLADMHIPVELCPTSNLQTHAIERIEDLPLRKFMEAGIIVTINTDDPSIEGTSIRDEWQKVIDAFNLSRDEVVQLLMNSVKAAFLSSKRKGQIQKELIDEY